MSLVPESLNEVFEPKSKEEIMSIKFDDETDPMEFRDFLVNMATEGYEMEDTKLAKVKEVFGDFLIFLNNRVMRRPGDWKWLLNTYAQQELDFQMKRRRLGDDS